MGSIGNHREYLEANNFGNLDEFDEQLMNDNTLQTPRTSVFDLSDASVDAFVNGAQKLLGADRLTPKQQKELNEIGNQAEQALATRNMSPKSRQKLLDLLDEIRR